MTLIPSIVLPKNIRAAIKRNGSIHVSPRLVRTASVAAAEVLAELKSGTESLSEEEAQLRSGGIRPQRGRPGTALYASSAFR